MKRRPKDLNKEETIVTLDALYTAASAVRGRDAVKLFLRDLLTPSERIMLGRRIIIARMLMRGVTYEDIGRRLRVSSTTVGRVHRWLQDQLPGYERAVKGMEEEFEKRRERKLYATSALYRLKKKYPLHFLLFPAPKDDARKYGEYPKG